ncbi:unnamed protein product [Rhizophagus irregularis]|nr:unnamed protein product [Rhizophagus irregularis]
MKWAAAPRRSTASRWPARESPDRVERAPVGGRAQGQHRLPACGAKRAGVAKLWLASGAAGRRAAAGHQGRAQAPGAPRSAGARHDAAARPVRPALRRTGRRHGTGGRRIERTARRPGRHRPGRVDAARSARTPVPVEAPGRVMQRVLAVVLALAITMPAHAAKDDDSHRFGIIGHSFNRGGEKQLRQALADSSEKSLAFVVVTGIKGEKEGCSDRLGPQQRVRGPAGGQPLLAEPPVLAGAHRQGRGHRAVFGRRCESVAGADRLARTAAARSAGPRRLCRNAQANPDAGTEVQGKVLLVDSAAHGKATPVIDWHGNLGHISIDGAAIEVAVHPGAKQIFTLQDPK